ncbi:MAG: sodium-dependent transporter [Bacteroidota bacterium]
MAKRPTLSRLGFILATVGSAVGMGNLWKFPYITYENEGGAFVLVYLLAVLLIGLPLMMLEIFMGRKGRSNVVATYQKLALQAKASPWWKGVGILAFIAMLFTVFYFAIVGWVFYYFFQCLSWSINDVDVQNLHLGQEFGAFLGNGKLQIICLSSVVLMSAFVVSFQLKKGVERAAKIMMPILGILLLVFLIAVIPTDGFSQAIAFLFHFGSISNEGILEAVGHSFFTLGLGAGLVMTLGSYFPNDTSIFRSSLWIVFFDTLIGIIASIIMFSIIFSVPEAERATRFSKSAAILFTTLPILLYELPFGRIITPLFYLSVVFAALTTTIAMSEVIIAFLKEQLQISRRKAAILMAAILLVIGIPAALSTGANEALSTWAPLGEKIGGGVLHIMDYTVTNWLLIISGLGSAIFVGWILDQKMVKRTFDEGGHRFRYFKIWQFAVRYVIPLAIVWILVSVVGGRTF